MNILFKKRTFALVLFCGLLGVACSKRKISNAQLSEREYITRRHHFHNGRYNEIKLDIEGVYQGKYKEAYHSYNSTLKTLIKTIEETKAFCSDSLEEVSYWVPTVNFNLRKPQYVILHHTAQDSMERTIQTFMKAFTQTSAHYVVSRNGEVVHMLNDYLRAWHAGVSYWGGITDMNSASIGIELDNNGTEPFADEQINSLILLLDSLKKKYNIPTANFLGHSDIAPGRKVDPSALFPWDKLAEKGFGRWYSEDMTIPPDDFNAMDGLRIIGYSIKNPIDAISVFNLHYLPNISIEDRKEMTDSTRMIIYDLYMQ